MRGRLVKHLSREPATSCMQVHMRIDEVEQVHLGYTRVKVIKAFAFSGVFIGYKYNKSKQMTTFVMSKIQELKRSTKIRKIR